MEPVRIESRGGPNPNPPESVVMREIKGSDFHIVLVGA